MSRIDVIMNALKKQMATTKNKASLERLERYAELLAKRRARYLSRKQKPLKPAPHFRSALVARQNKFRPKVGQ